MYGLSRKLLTVRGVNETIPGAVVDNRLVCEGGVC
jgi:hypothetical protein